ncbi:MAG: hypothetical protein ACLFVD_03740 [Dehalococcoidia bacterium]
MDEMKSAWEIAQQRVERLGKLSSEEREQQERERYRQIGQALAQKWLDSPRRPDTTADLGEQEAKGRDVIRRAAVVHLAESIDLTAAGAVDRAGRAIDVISSLAPELQRRIDELAGLVQEHEEAERRLRQEVEGECREALHRMRISGTAVGDINVEASRQWQTARSELAGAYSARLDDARRKMMG